METLSGAVCSRRYRGWMNSHLAQLNVARWAVDPTSPTAADFFANLDRINALADGSPGFVWRLQTEDGDATGIRAFDDPLILVNLSTWEDVASLKDYAYRSGHVEIMRRRQEWFEKMDEPHTVLWWVPAGHEPTVCEAEDRLRQLRADGPTPEAFDFRTTYPAPDQAISSPGEP